MARVFPLPEDEEIERRAIRSGSAADKFLQALGLGNLNLTAEERAARQIGDIEAGLAGSFQPGATPQVPPIPEPVTPGRTFNLLGTQVSEQDISEGLNFLGSALQFPGDIGQTLLPRDTLAQLFAGEEEAPPEDVPPARRSRPELPDLLGSLSFGGGGGGARDITFRSPFIEAPEGEGVELPDVPDASGMLARLEALGPVTAPELDPLPFILQGLAAGALGEEGNIGDLLLAAGLGALGGRGQAGQRRQELAAEAAEADRAFQIALANAEAAARGEQFEREQTQALERQRRAERREELEIGEQQQLVPRVEGGILLQPRREGEEVVTTATNLKGGGGIFGGVEGNKNRLRVLAAQALAARNPETMFDAMSAADPLAVEAAVQDVTGTPLVPGLELTLTQKAQVVDLLSREAPELLDEAGFSTELLGILRGLGGSPAGF